jgi:hypothetical protein
VIASAYRTPADVSSGDHARDAERPMELLPMFALLWLASFARVLAAVASHETFDSEPTLALLAILLLPVLMKDELAARAHSLLKRL